MSKIEGNSPIVNLERRPSLVLARRKQRPFLVWKADHIWGWISNTSNILVARGDTSEHSVSTSRQISKKLIIEFETRTHIRLAPKWTYLRPWRLLEEGKYQEIVSSTAPTWQKHWSPMSKPHGLSSIIAATLSLPFDMGATNYTCGRGQRRCQSWKRLKVKLFGQLFHFVWQRYWPQGIDHCPDICILNVTTTGQTHHQQFPILYHLQRDPGERYPIQPTSPEYKKQVEVRAKISNESTRLIFQPFWIIQPLKKLAQEHSENLVVGKPQLNWCDKAVMVIEINVIKNKIIYGQNNPFLPTLELGSTRMWKLERLPKGSTVQPIQVYLGPLKERVN